MTSGKVKGKDTHGGFPGESRPHPLKAPRESEGAFDFPDPLTARVSQRETISGFEVVEAAVADELLRAMIVMAMAHRRWRLAAVALNELYDQREPRTEQWRKARNRGVKERLKYRKARVACYRVIVKAIGQEPFFSDHTKKAVH